jgi:hypothetical protein
MSYLYRYSSYREDAKKKVLNLNLVLMDIVLKGEMDGIEMTDKDKLSHIEVRADNIIKDHNGVYLEKKLYTTLKIEFPSLSRKDFQAVLNQLSKGDYVFEHGLIKLLKVKEPDKLTKKYIDNKKTGKGDSELTRLPDKREI